MHKTLKQIIENNTMWCKNRERTRQRLRDDLREVLLTGCCSIYKMLDSKMTREDIKEVIENMFEHEDCSCDRCKKFEEIYG